MGPGTDTSDAPFANDVDISGRWVDDGGTVIDLRAHGDGRVSGTVRFGTDGSTYKPYEMHGSFILRPDGNHGLVGTVSGWPYPASVTVWLGAVDPGGETLSTRLLSAAGTPPPRVWSSESGTVFRRVAPVLPGPAGG